IRPAVEKTRGNTSGRARGATESPGVPRGLALRRQLRDLDVLESHLHRLGPDVDLKCNDALLVDLGVLTIDEPRSVENDRDVLPLGGDHELVPIILLDEGLGLRPLIIEEAASALFVEESPITIGDVGLGARDHAFGRPLAAELDARVAV